MKIGTIFKEDFIFRTKHTTMKLLRMSRRLFSKYFLSFSLYDVIIDGKMFHFLIAGKIIVVADTFIWTISIEESCDKWDDKWVV